MSITHETITSDRILDYSANEEERLKEFQALNYEGFKANLVALNHIVRPEENIVDFDADKNAFGYAGTAGHRFPRREDKEILLQEILQTAQATDNIQEAAIILAVGVLATHPFTDGNGRVSRLLYGDMSKGEALPDEVRVSLGKEGHHEIVDLGIGIEFLAPLTDGTVYKNMGIPFENAYPWKTSFSNEGAEKELLAEGLLSLSAEEAQDLRTSIKSGKNDEQGMDSEGLRYALVKYRLNNTIDPALLRHHSGGRTAVDINALIRDMPDGAKHQFVQDLWEYRANYVRALVSLVGDSHDQHEDGAMSSRDYFIGKAATFLTTRVEEPR